MQKRSTQEFHDAQQLCSLQIIPVSAWRKG